MDPYEKTLNIISRAWGRKQSGYCFFPWIDRAEQEAKGIRRAGFYEGPAFKWPRDRDKILTHIAQHTEHDLYWCPSLFEYESRRTDVAMDEHALWADLDAVDPRTFTDDEYPATIAWETSPGHYQALWIISQGDVQGASWPGNENQRLTYYLGADLSGWDTTQRLRMPGWTNHKPEYRDKVSGSSPKGRLLWTNGRTYLPDDFQDLPEVRESGSPNDLTDAVIQEIEATKHNDVLARVKLKLTQRIRDFIRAKQVSGDRSSVLWEIERSLADAGCTLAEIVAVVRHTAWNKYDGRADEFKRLIIEANKALAQKPEDQITTEDVLREEAKAATLQRADILLLNIEPPKWLVKDILTEGGLGFIAGEPKSFKSWFGLDLAISVSSGARFLNHFDVLRPGPVMYLQEEDSAIIVKSRRDKILKDKRQDRLTLEDGVVWHEPEQSVAADAPLLMLLQGGLVLSEDVWQEWLDEQLAAGYQDDTYRLVMIDTMMMTVGAVEENRSQEMTTKFFKPLKQLARKHTTALVLVHHLNKNGGKDAPRRPGQRLLGSVANHAWAEDSMYLSLEGNNVRMETESKSWKPNTYTINGIGQQKGWRPVIGGDHTNGPTADRPEPIRHVWESKHPILKALNELGGSATAKTLAEHLNISLTSVQNKCRNLADQGKIQRGRGWTWHPTS